VNLRSFVGVIVGLASTLVSAQVTQIGASSGALTTNIDRTKVRLVQRLGAQVPLDAAFRDQGGTSRTFADLVGGKPSVVIPIFYLCKGVCGLELQGTIAALRQMKKDVLGRDFNIVVMSIDPTETPALAAGKYRSTVDELAKPGTEKGWRFVVGDWASIHKVTDAVGFKYTYETRDGTPMINHPSGIVFVTPKGVVSSYIYGAAYTAPEFTRNIDYAGREKLGAPAEEFFFGCICVDPLTGKRSFEIQNILKVAGGLTVGIMTLAILVLSGKASLRRRRASA
jgi:protein SCO1/2